MRNEILSKVGLFLSKVVFGPEVKGEVRDVVVDRNAPAVHVLIRTDDNEWKHQIYDDRSVVLSYKGIKTSMPVWKPGDRYWVRMRGKGMILLPWSKIERNPFNLVIDKPQTPLSDNLKAVLKDADIDNL